MREIYAGAGLRPLWPLWRRRLLRADALACVSARGRASSSAAARRRSCSTTGCRAIAAARGRGTQAARALGLPADAFVVALLGRISDWKGQDVLAEALARARGESGPSAWSPATRWPGQERHERRARATGRRAGIDERLRLLGFRDDVDTVLGAADAVVGAVEAPGPARPTRPSRPPPRACPWSPPRTAA